MNALFYFAIIGGAAVSAVFFGFFAIILLAVSI